ncbi:Na+/H+ antiporter NhaC [Sporosarcina trichiuri]|uniref:Na+/H+ antiporter NhaC n=1 Tax=Sporosarcina trichiuri TaxID=3056445 RepID=UPI0025B2B8FB|nr:Na+/H+ antiporter NhaC [Sporosarcina sp. 0.2-SM1T-5]WJY26377.1 Na+/H+ antiporter NhaC [Sporosarcina sp. 0.2-SM1T-5]
MTRKPTLFEAILPIIVMLLLTSIGFAGYGIKIEPLLILASLFAGVIALRVGVSWDQMIAGIREKIDAAMPALLILISIGILIGMWTMAGTIPAMIYFGLKIINPSFIVLLAFVVSAIVSIVTGSSWGSIGTVGVALMGIASGMDVSAAATAGAIVSGAYFGDKLSPLSDTTNLAPLVVGTELHEHIKHMLYTTVPAAAVAMIVYAIVGFNSSDVQADSSAQTNAMLSSLDGMFTWSLWLLVPALIILYGTIRKLPTLPVVVLSSFTAGIIAIFVQGFTVKNAFQVTVSGFDVSMVNKAGFDADAVIPEVLRLVNQGGMQSMTGVVLIALCAFSFAGIVSVSGCLEVLVNALVKLVKRTGDLILVTVLSCITTALVTANTYLPLIIPGELYKDTYRKKNLAAKNLSRTLEDSGTVVIPLVPWSTSGVFIAGTLGVSTFSYLPWAVLCYTGFIFAIILGYTGIGITKLAPGDETAESAE